MGPIIRQAKAQDAQNVISVLTEAAQWLEQNGMTMWRDEELLSARFDADVEAGLFFMAEQEGMIAGVVKFQLEDALFWPDVPPDQSAFVHRLAVRRRFAGGGISKALLDWAVEKTCGLGRPYLRLDCEASRQKLRSFYEKFGFRHHSDRQVGPYFVSRYEYGPIQSGPQIRSQA
jgi:GNAT superfamily N-acetyltransferase